MVYDLTHFIDENCSVYSSEEKPKFFNIANYEEGYSVSGITLGSHTGTHIDVPKHIFKDGKTLDDYNLEDFMGKALVINCLNEKEIKFEKVKNEFNKYKDKNIKYILFYTGYEEKWGDKEYLEGYGVLTKETTEFLVSIKGLVGIGIDCISVDNDEFLLNHKILLGNKKLIIENLCNLKEKTGIFDIIIAPMKLKNSDGAPIRMYLLD